MEPAETDPAGNIASYFTDPLGSARVVAGPSSTLAESDYYPFGGERVIASTLAPGNKYQFTGMERDAESGLDHTLYRQYSSTLGRWASPDPLAGDVTNPQSLNRYGYVLNSPTNFIDPLGLDCQSDFPGQFCIDVTATASSGGFSNSAGGGIGGGAAPFHAQLQDNSEPHVGAGHGGGGGSADCPSCIPLIFAPGLKDHDRGPGDTPTDQQAATQFCQDRGQISFNVPFTEIPVTISLSASFFGGFSTTNDISLTFPPSAGESLDITVGAPEGPNIPVQVGVGKNASVGTFLTPKGAHGVSLSIPLSPVAGSPVTISPTVANACGLLPGGG